MNKKHLLLFCLSLIFNTTIFAQNEPFQLRQVACDLEQPWEITYGPDNQLWVTESRDYKLLRIDPNTGAQSVVLDASNLKNFPNNNSVLPQGGFTGLALHPDLLNGKPYVYVAYQYEYNGCLTNDEGCFFKTKIARYDYNPATGTVSNEQILLDNIPGSTDHNGGRLTIGDTGGVPHLFYSVGDMGAGQFSNENRQNNAQDPNILEGKILRLNLEPVNGSYIPSNNNFGNAVYTLGHRNPQGLVYANGTLYSAEHGPFTDDELNIIQSGQNYGHPLVSGFADGNYNGVRVGTGQGLPLIGSEQSNAANIQNYTDPIDSYYAASNADVTDFYNYAVNGNAPFANFWLYRPSIAPAGIDHYGSSTISGWQNSILMATLKKSTIYRAKLSADGQSVQGELIPYFEGLGRFRDIALSPDGSKIYVACDKYGSTSGPSQGTSIPPNNPGCILEFEYSPNITGCQDQYDGFTFIGDYNGSKYFISNETGNWANGSSLAEFYNGYLASPNDQAENEFIRTYLAANNEIAFIGISDGNTEGTFELSSGEALNFNNFSGTNSDNDDYAVMNFWDGSWGVNNLTTERRYIIEIPCSVNCTDNDGDGVCAADDCDDNNPAIPTTPGTACNDGNPQTTNDIIQSDGCTCVGNAGTLTLSCNNGDITEFIPAGSNSVSVNWGSANAFSTCLISTPIVTQIAGPASGSALVGGTYNVVYEATDGCNNTSQCGFTISVMEGTVGCNIITSTADGTITIEGLTGAENAKVFDADFNVLFECAPWNGNLCTGIEMVSGLTTGEYFVSVQSGGCDEFIPVSVSAGCVDNDNDGVCAIDDCDDNDASLPAAPNSICDDNNPNTTGDVIQADGCTCLGVQGDCSIDVNVLNVVCDGDFVTYTVEVFGTNTGPTWGTFIPTDAFGNNFFQSFAYGGPVEITAYGGIGNGPFTVGIFDTTVDDCLTQFQVACQGLGCNVSTFADNGTITIEGLTGAENAKVFDADYNILFECAPWNGNPCTGTEIASGLSTGEYFVSVQSAICDIFLNVNVDGNCPDADNDGTCDIDDCEPNNPNLPTTPETSCDDNNPTTQNDVIQPDGCTCEGEFVSTSLTIQCPDDVTVQIPNGASTIVANWPNAVASSTCPTGLVGQAQQVSGVQSGTVVGPGSYFLTFFAEDNCGLNSSCSITATILPAIGNGCNVTTSTSNNTITVSGLTSGENTKLFDENFAVIWECNPWSNNGNNACSSSEVISNLPNGNYSLSVQSGLCDEFIPITIDDNGCVDNDNDGVCADVDCNDNEPFLPTTPGTPCDDNDASTENDVYQADGCNCKGTPVNDCTVMVDAFYNGTFGGVEITGMSSSYNVKLFDENINVVWECNPWSSPQGCEPSYTYLVSQAGGNFFLSVQSDNCDEWIPISVPTENCIDFDNDGVCNFEDCDNFNPNLPAPAGTPCDDMNSATENDVILSDGCTCAGTPIVGVCNVDWTETGFGQVTITGLSSAENTKIFDSSANSSGLIWECNPWSTPCSNTEVVDGLIPGEQYFLAVQSDICSEWLPFSLIGMIDNGDNSQLNKALTLDKFSIINVFPNPASNEAFVNIESTFNSEMTLEIYDVIGQKKSTNLTSIENGNNTIQLDINNLNAGIYHLFLRNGNGQTKSVRFVKIRD